MADMGIKVKVGLDQKDFSQGIKGVQSGLRLAGGNFGKLASLGAASMASLGAAAAAAGVAIAGMFAAASIKKFIEFDDSITRTTAILGDRGLGGEAERLTDEIKRIGETTRFTATQVAEAAQQFALAGIEVSQMVDDKALENLVQLSIAAGVDVKEAAGIAVASVKGFRLEMSEMGRVNDVLVKTFTSSNTTITTLGESMKFLGPTASAAGLTIEETAAAVGALGNAGIQGSMAGTGLRMALNKLIRPGDDVRKTMQKLGLDGMLVLQPAGQAAQAAMQTLGRSITNTKKEVDDTTSALKTLTAEMTGMSIEQQKNNLQIMKIRRQAEKEGRKLTEGEEQQIARIESANADLAIGMQEASIEQQMLRQQNAAATESLAAQEERYSALNKTVADSTMGITSLNEVISQLQVSGASTAQILEVFGVRGGGAINALLADAQGFKQLTADVQASAGATEEFAETMKGSAKEEVFTMQSAIEGVMIELGEALMPVMSDFLDIIRDDIVPILKDMIPLFQAVGVVIRIVAFVFKIWLVFMKPLFNMIGAFGELIDAVMSGRWVDALKAVVKIFGNLFLFLNPVLRVIIAIASAIWDVISAVGWLKDAFAKLWGYISDIPVLGDVIGFVGDIIGDIGSFLGFAEGGVVTKATAAVVGEGGEPEVIAPLSTLTSVVGTAGAAGLIAALPGPNPSVSNGVLPQSATPTPEGAGSLTNSTLGGDGSTDIKVNIDKIVINGATTEGLNGSQLGRSITNALAPELLRLISGSNTRAV